MHRGSGTVSHIDVANTTIQGDWAAVGRSLRELRVAAGLTLVELATRVGLSQPFLSQVENGRARLSMRSLYRVAGELDTTPQALLGNGVSDQLSPTLVPRAGGVGVVLADGADVAACRVLLPASAPFHAIEYTELPTEFGEYWAHAGFEAVYVVRGAIELDVDGSVSALSDGDLLFYPARSPHRMRAASDRLKVLLLESPAPGDADRLHGAVDQGIEPDPTR